MKQRADPKKPKKIKKAKATNFEKINEILKLLDIKEDNNKSLPNEIKSESNTLYNNTLQPSIEKRKNYNGIPDKNYFINLKNTKTNYSEQDIILQDVAPDGNCGYRALSLQLYGDEKFYNNVRLQIYNYLSKNKDAFSGLIFEDNFQLLNSDQYIDNIKNDKFWMGDLELSVIDKIYDAIVIVFKKLNDNTYNIYNIYGDIKESQRKIDIKKNPILENSLVLLCNNFTKKGNLLTPKFGKKGFYSIPATVVGLGKGNFYPIRLDLNYNDLIKGDVFYVDYKLIKEVKIGIYNEFLKINKESEIIDENLLNLNNNLNGNNFLCEIKEKKSDIEDAEKLIIEDNYSNSNENISQQSENNLEIESLNFDVDDGDNEYFN